MNQVTKAKPHVRLVEGATVCQESPSVQSIEWPRKFDLFGIQVSATTYEEVVEVLVQAAKAGQAAAVDFTPVSLIVEAAYDSVFRNRLNKFEIVCPDGQPVRWCLNRFHSAGLSDRVCGTTTMLRLCAAAEREGLGIYLYGSTEQTLAQLHNTLLTRFPRLRIAGLESPPFRALSYGERQAATGRINASGAAFVFVGTGSPRQENWVAETRPEIRAVQLCVGAAFDFIAGTKPRAPQWMQRCGLEWLHRVCSEPRRLGKRYAVGNARFAALLVPELLRINRAARP